MSEPDVMDQTLLPKQEPVSYSPMNRHTRRKYQAKQSRFAAQLTNRLKTNGPL